MKTKIVFTAICTLLVSFILRAQYENDTNIIFVDYNPDSVLNCSYNIQDSLCIDLNQDGTQDFKFYYELYSALCYPYVVNLNNDCWYYYFNDTITDSLNNPSISWLTGNNFWSTYSNTGVQFGIKLKEGVDNYYGWIRALGGPYGGLPVIVDKYAFCKIPNYPFHLGQTTLTGLTSITDNSGDIKVFTENAGNTLVIQSEKIMDYMRLISINGTEVVLRNKINSISAKINVTGIVRGAYILQVGFRDNTVFSTQIVL